MRWCFLLLLGVLPVCAAPVTIHVSPAGDDAATGTAERPVRSLAAARDRLRAANGSPKTVRLSSGVYWLREPLLLGRQDSGTADEPIVWEAADGARPMLCGGLEVSGFTPAADGLLQVDLTAKGLAGARFHQLFWRPDGAAFPSRLTLARYPNADPQQPRYGGWLYCDEPQPSGSIVTWREGDVPWEAWGAAPEAEVVSTYARGWNHAITPVERIDLKLRQMTVKKVRSSFYRMNRYYLQNLRQALDAPGEWYLDEATDTLYLMPPAGFSGTVIVPTADAIVEVRGTIPYPHGYLNTAHRGPRDEFPMPPDAPPDAPAGHLVFRNLDLAVSRQDGFQLVGAEQVTVERCRITGVGNVGVNLGAAASTFHEVGNPREYEKQGHPLGAGGGGQILLLEDPARRCRVIGCDVWETGSEGIMLFGTANLAVNNHVWDIGLYAKDAPCINLLGEQNVARRNTLHDCPRCTIFIKGVDNVAELNDNYFGNLETTDMGLIRFVQRNAHLKGNIVRHNIVSDSVGYGFNVSTADHYESPFYTWGIYLDDYTCGTLIEGNIITRCARGGVMIHGGGDNLVKGNFCDNAGQYQVEFAPIQDEGAGAKQVYAGNRVEQNVLLADQPDSYPYRFTRMPADRPTMQRNLVWTGGQPVVVVTSGIQGVKGWDNWLKLGMESQSQVAEPKLRELGHGLRVPVVEGAVKAIGFEPIPVEQIGCYQDAARVSWPLAPNRDRQREQPLLPTLPGYVPTPKPQVTLAGPVNQTFDDQPVGSKPAKSDVLAPMPSSLAVSADRGYHSPQSLKFVDAPGLASDWMPRIYWPLDFGEGTATISFQLWLDAKQPPALYIDPRQYRGANGEYYSGPMLNIAPDGTLSGAATPVKLPLDTWIALTMTVPLGQPKPVTTMTIRIDGQPDQTVEVPSKSPNFQRLDRLVISSLSKVASVFYLDGVKIGAGGED